MVKRHKKRRDCSKAVCMYKHLDFIFIFFAHIITVANTVSDPVIEEHFRRSLGKNYKDAEPVSNSVSITGSVDDHFAKALGDAWLQIKAKGGGHQSSESDS